MPALMVSDLGFERYMPPKAAQQSCQGQSGQLGASQQRGGHGGGHFGLQQPGLQAPHPPQKKGLQNDIYHLPFIKYFRRFAVFYI